jgi:replicative DNA helicase
MNSYDQSVSQHERALIAGLFSGRVPMQDIADIVSASDFVSSELAATYTALKDISGSGVPLALSSILSELRARNVHGQTLVELIGGEYAIKTLADEGRITSRAATYHASQVAEAGRKRRLRAALLEAAERCNDASTPAIDIITAATADLRNLETVATSDYYSAGDAAESAFNEIHEAWQAGEQVGLQTGLRDLDSHVGGFRPGQNIVLAARPSIGKSCVGAEIAQRVASSGGRVLFANLEMSQAEMGQRFLSRASGVPSNLLTRPKELNEFDISRLRQCRERIASWPLTLWGGSGRSIQQLASAARRYHARAPLSLLVLDYLGLLSGDGKDRYQQVTNVSQQIKALAMELKIPILTLCQLNRDSEKHGREPNLSDLRDSGAIEQDADIVIFIVRDRDAEDCRLKIAKFRNGALGEVLVRFEGAYSRVMDVELATSWTG